MVGTVLRLVPLGRHGKDKKGKKTRPLRNAPFLRGRVFLFIGEVVNFGCCPLSAKQAKQLAKTVYVQLRQSKCLEPVPDLVTAVFKGLCVITISGSEVDDPLAGAGEEDPVFDFAHWLPFGQHIVKIDY